MVCLHPLAALGRLERHELCLCVHVRAEHAKGARRKIDVELRVAVHIVELPKLALLSSAAHTCALDQAKATSYCPARRKVAHTSAQGRIH